MQDSVGQSGTKALLIPVLLTKALKTLELSVIQQEKKVYAYQELSKKFKNILKQSARTEFTEETKQNAAIVV